MGKETILSFNGSGTFVRLYNWVNDAAANIKIRADRMDAEMNGMATGLSTCITKDGQTTVTANLPMATYRHTGVGAAVNRTDYARAGEVQDGSFNWVDGGGTADAITASYSIPLTALVDGQLCFVRATAANATTTPTFSPSGLTARTIVKNGNQALAAGDIAGDGHELILRYRLSDTKWELLNPAVTGVPTLTGNNTLSGNNTFTGKILTPDDGELTISSGAVTVTGVFHTLDTESNAASDDLDTINGGSDGQLLIIRTEDSTRDVVLTQSGNIVLPFGVSVTLGTTSQSAALIYDGALSKWIVIAVSSGYATAAQGALADTAIQPSTKLTLGTMQASTSGTSIDFTSIPSGTKRVTINFASCSTSGTSNPQVQIGDSGGIETSGYLACASFISGSSPGSNTFTSGFGWNANSAAYIWHGSIVLTLMDASTNLWAMQGMIATTDSARVFHIGGSKALSATLDRVRITTVGGTDTFDGGNINIVYE
jgi:hypothetical protein